MLMSMGDKYISSPTGDKDDDDGGDDDGSGEDDGGDKDDDDGGGGIRHRHRHCPRMEM